MTSQVLDWICYGIGMTALSLLGFALWVGFCAALSCVLWVAVESGGLALHRGRYTLKWDAPNGVKYSAPKSTILKMGPFALIIARTDTIKTEAE